MEYLELKLRGPLTLGEPDPDVAGLFEQATAWEPGIYVWTFLYNHSDRVHRTGAAHVSVAVSHADHVGAFLRGDRAFHAARARAAGRLERVYAPGDGMQAYREHAADLRAEIRALRVFYAPVPDGDGLRERIVSAIAGHLSSLGGKALDWFAPDNARPSWNAGTDSPLTVRFYRPVHMASMPDELVM